MRLKTESASSEGQGKSRRIDSRKTSEEGRERGVEKKNGCKRDLPLRRLIGSTVSSSRYFFVGSLKGIVDPEREDERENDAGEQATCPALIFLSWSAK